MTNLNLLKGKKRLAYDLAILAKEAGNTEELVKYTKEVEELENQIKALQVKEEAPKTTKEEFTYYTVYGEVDHLDKSIKLLGNVIEFEVTNGMEETYVTLAPKFVNHIVNVEWEMNKSDKFIINLTKKLVSMYKENFVA